ncbi:hypothetical protein ACA910_000315 [Epithemia clementina (nom. ined.)]
MLNSCQAIAQPPNQPAYQISLSSCWDGNKHALVRIEASDDATAEHVPSTFVLVLDESGSMGSPAVHHDDSDGSSGLSQLDVVKHASRTIIETLSEHDRLAVVAFSDQARVILPLTFMTSVNKKNANKKIDELLPTFSTNLYDGLLTALEMIRAESTTPANANVMVLTDGMPNVRPPRGELDTLQRYLDSHPAQRAVRISTFGFGYSLMSRLLSDIAREGGSIYSFIPDSSFVGTVFINAVANLLSVAAPRGATLRLEANEGVEIVDCLSGQKFTKTSWGMNVEIPSILYGQAIEVFVQFGSKPQMSDPFHAFVEMSSLEETLETQTKMIGPNDPEYALLKKSEVRGQLINFVKQAELTRDPSVQQDLNRCQSLLTMTKANVSKISNGIDLPEIADIRKDIDGQITEAYSSAAFYDKWGCHYILSLAGSHALQQCINFKDPGIQQYATAKFKIHRDAAEQIFLQLKPPQPSRRATAPVQSMRSYYNSSGPCFAAGNVSLATGETIPISQLRAGHVVRTSHGQATVVCIVETPSVDGMEHLVELDDGVLVTPWHPVRRAVGGKDTEKNKWQFPCVLAEARHRPCQSVYSFVLDGDTSLRIGSYDGIALGHGNKEGGDESIVEHEYLGTERVISDLSKMRGWSAGHVHLPPNPAIRDSKTLRIVGFRHANEADNTNPHPPTTFTMSLQHRCLTLVGR